MCCRLLTLFPPVLHFKSLCFQLSVQHHFQVHFQCLLHLNAIFHVLLWVLLGKCVVNKGISHHPLYHAFYAGENTGHSNKHKN